MSGINVTLDQQIVGLTPEVMEKAFWSMHSADQAKFFDELAKVVEQDHGSNPSAYSLGEMQWCFLKNELREPGMERANKMHMALSAFAYDFWPQKPEGARTGL